MSDLRVRLLAAVSAKEPRLSRQNAKPRCDGVTALSGLGNPGVMLSRFVTPQLPSAIKSVTPSHSDFGDQPYNRIVAALSERCPDLVDEQKWRKAAADAAVFLRQWGNQAFALGWTARDLFGLAEIPDKPGPRYQRLSRYDQTGLIWMLQGRPVVALTKNTAVIQTTNDTVFYYRLLRSAGWSAAMSRALPYQPKGLI
jgi:hypothetical protein